MQNYYPIYRKPKDWAILDKQIIHDFSLVENPIEIYQVLIGTLHYEDINFLNYKVNKRTPIIRWLTKKQYEGALNEDL